MNSIGANVEALAEALDLALDEIADLSLSGDYLKLIARRLADSGFVAPAPLREEWTVMGEHESGDDWVIDVEFATRLGAEDFLARNEWASDDGGYVARRLMTDWLPADEAD